MEIYEKVKVFVGVNAWKNKVKMGGNQWKSKGVCGCKWMEK